MTEPKQKRQRKPPALPYFEKGDAWDPEVVRQLTPFQRLVRFVRVRHEAARNRLCGVSYPRPEGGRAYVQDFAVGRYRFCNLRRMDDNVSDWLLKRWYEPWHGHPNMLTAVTLARFVNNPNTLREIGFPETWDAKRTHETITRLMASGVKTFHSAYLSVGTLGGTKADQIIYKVVDALHQNQPELDLTSMRETAVRLLPSTGFASFMAGQVVADLRWALGDVNKGDWADRNTWAPVGPGSTRGLNRLHGRPLNKKLKEDQFLEELIEMRQMLLEATGSFPGDGGLPHPVQLLNTLELHDIQNIACERDKYERVLWSQGTPRQKYKAQ